MVVECVVVKSITGKDVMIDIGNCKDIAQLKLQYAELEGLPCDRQRLIHKGRELADHETLLSAQLGRGAVIHAVPRLHSSSRLSSGPMRVTVCIPSNDRIIALDVEPEDSAEVVKGKVESNTGLAPQQQILRRRNDGAVVHDGSTLRDIGTCEGDVFDCIPRRAPTVIDAAIHSAPVSPIEIEDTIVIQGAQSAPVSPHRADSGIDAMPVFPSIERWADDDELDLPIPPMPVESQPETEQTRALKKQQQEQCDGDHTPVPADGCQHQALQEFTARDEMYVCSSCHEPVPLNGRMFACRDCGMDICRVCGWSEEQKEHADTPNTSTNVEPTGWYPSAPPTVAAVWGAPVSTADHSVWAQHTTSQHWPIPAQPYTVVEGQPIVQGNANWSPEWDPVAKPQDHWSWDCPISRPSFAYPTPYDTWGGVQVQMDAPARRRRRGGKNRGSNAKNIAVSVSSSSETVGQGIMPPDYAIVPCAEPAAAA